MRKVDKTKKSNWKCEYCNNWEKETGYCRLLKQPKYYYNRCKQFVWFEVNKEVIEEA